jgi:hypothetical protein
MVTGAQRGKRCTSRGGQRLRPAAKPAAKNSKKATALGWEVVDYYEEHRGTPLGSKRRIAQAFTAQGKMISGTFVRNSLLRWIQFIKQ